jgi:exodeoxyribonuclease VII large subunit
VNGPEQEAISVADFMKRLRRAVEATGVRDWIEGEVASLKSASSGHLYFTLKDEREDACLECVMYRREALRGRRFVVEGARVQIRGRPTVWPPRGRLQFVADGARPAGRGALLAALEALKEKLRAEGLFDTARKRPLPPDVRIVGLVTSAHGAAVHDIVTVAFRRGSVRIVLSPALVQGDGAPASILSAIERLERYPGLDVVIIGRGGGSGDDLMAFNDERVARRVAAIRVPVVSAVGHEVDTTLTDWVADVRAATPSQAAELVVADVGARAEALGRARVALARAMHARVLEDEHTLERLQSRLTDPRFVIAEKQQHLDDFMVRMERRMTRESAKRRASLDELRSRLSARHPRAVVEHARAELGPLSARLFATAELRLGVARGALGEVASRLHALSPLNVLGRGYAIATHDGRALRRASDVAPGDAITLRLHEGRVDATVDRTDEGSQ